MNSQTAGALQSTYRHTACARLSTSKLRDRLEKILTLTVSYSSSYILSDFIKLPPFWTKRSEVWFHQVEAQVAAGNPPITADLTKFYHLVEALDNVTAGEVEAIILSFPTKNKY